MPDMVTETYLNQMHDLAGTLPGFDTMRARAMERFADTGIPSARDENWRYSDLKMLRNSALAPARTPLGKTPAPDSLVEPSARLVFVNGRYDETLSDLGDLWQAASIRPLANHMMANADRASELRSSEDGIGLLNTALVRDGIVLSIPAGIEIDEPIEILHIMRGAGTSAAHVRHLVELGEGAKATVFERFLGDEDAYWLNSVLQARITEGAVLNHYRLQEEGPASIHTATALVSVGAAGLYNACNISLGGSVARFEARVRLLVDEAKATVDGVALAATGQSHDMLVHVDHRMPNTNSDQIFRTVADARGKSSFQGKVTVATDAQQTLADQSFKALLLDRTAEANAKPELEIFADDVKCSHGATVGELDEKALFYLTSRGIDPATARQMLVEAFTDEALARITSESLLSAIRERVGSWMQAHAPNRKDTA